MLLLTLAGLEPELVACPLLSMADEWGKRDVSWTDWKGVTHRAKSEHPWALRTQQDRRFGGKPAIFIGS